MNKFCLSLMSVVTLISLQGCGFHIGSDSYSIVVSSEYASKTFAVEGSSYTVTYIMQSYGYSDYCWSLNCIQKLDFEDALNKLFTIGQNLGDSENLGLKVDDYVQFKINGAAADFRVVAIKDGETHELVESCYNTSITKKGTPFLILEDSGGKKLNFMRVHQQNNSGMGC